MCAEGDIEGAKERVRMASKLWSPIRLEILDDEALADVWPWSAAVAGGAAFPATL